MNNKNSNLSDFFVKSCTNAYRAVTLDQNGKLVPQDYRRDDLSEWSKEAFNRGDHYFYVEPVNPKQPYGRLQLCEPKYVYKLKRSLSEEEYEQLIK